MKVLHVLFVELCGDCQVSSGSTTHGHLCSLYVFKNIPQSNFSLVLVYSALNLIMKGGLMVKELLYLPADSSLCRTFFMTNSVNLIINRVVMEALLGMDSLSLKTGKNIALCVEETAASIQNSIGILWKVL